MTAHTTSTHEVERQLRELVDASPTAAFLTTEEGSIIHANARARESMNGSSQAGCNIRFALQDHGARDITGVNAPGGFRVWFLENGPDPRDVFDAAQRASFSDAFLIARTPEPIPEANLGRGDEVVSLDGRIGVFKPWKGTRAAALLGKVAKRHKPTG